MRNATIISAIQSMSHLSFDYMGAARIVEPQTYGLSSAGHEVLRAHQVAGDSRSRQPAIAKLFLVSKMSNLRKLPTHFDEALPAHNPHDSAMIEVFATLPLPMQKSPKR